MTSPHWPNPQPPPQEKGLIEQLAPVVLGVLGGLVVGASARGSGNTQAPAHVVAVPPPTAAPRRRKRKKKASPTASPKRSGARPKRKPPASFAAYQRFAKTERPRVLRAGFTGKAVTTEIGRRWQAKKNK